MHDPLSILLVDDDLGDLRFVAREIRRSGISAECFSAVSVAEALELCAARRFDCAIVDYQLPGQDGLQALLSLGQMYPDLPLVMSTGQGDEAIATEAMKRGALDYIRKSDIMPSSIRRVIENAVEKTLLRRRVSEQQQELARFADVLVHDLRAPSSSIQSFIWEIQNALRDGNLESVAAYCQWAANAAARMVTLIATLYQYTRLDGEVPFGPVALQDVFEGALANLHKVIHEKGAAVAHGDLPNVTGSVPLLEQLLQNLIGNGIKYCKSPTPLIHVDASPRSDGMWLVSVKDNGIGIPKEDHLRIFESFTRLHGVGEYEGTGLGLATCAKIVARHGGNIWCESALGQGSTISFTLPAATGSASGDAGDAAGPSAQSSAQSAAQTNAQTAAQSKTRAA